MIVSSILILYQYIIDIYIILDMMGFIQVLIETLFEIIRYYIRDIIRDIIHDIS